MVNWKEPFFYSAINPIWVNNTLLCSRAVTVICGALNLRRLQTAAGQPKRWQDAAENRFYIMQSIELHCTVFRRAGDTQEREAGRERRRDSEEEGQRTGDIPDNKSGCTYLPGNLISLFQILEAETLINREQGLSSKVGVRVTEAMGCATVWLCALRIQFARLL